jgi:Cu2+-exporting ATPase
MGIEASVDGHRHRLGTLPFVAQIAGTLHATEPERAGATRVWLGCDGRYLACFDLTDRLRPEAQSVVQRLQAAGKRVLIWSGDSMSAVGAVARQLGVDAFEAGLLPEDKQARMVDLQQRGAVMAMVGDGVNDAPVLAQAQLSIAMGSGALLAQTHADIVLLSGQLQGLIEAMTVAARAVGIMRQNLIWATAYNAIALSCAAAGLVTPWMAGVGMGASSLIVVLNALRVRGGGRGTRSEGRGWKDSSMPLLAPRSSPLAPRP